MALPEDDLTADQLDDLRAAYEAGAGALPALARRFALSPRALRLIASRLNFGARPPLAPFQRRAPVEPAPQAPQGRETAGDDAGPAKAPAREKSPGAGATRNEATATTPAREKTARKKTARKKTAPKPAARKPRVARAASPAKPDDPALKPLDMSAMAERLRQAAARELVKIDDQLEAGADVERHARVLASLVKTLGDLARLAAARAAPASDGASGDGGEWSLDDLRAELARRIDALAPREPAG